MGLLLDLAIIRQAFVGWYDWDWRASRISSAVMSSSMWRITQENDRVGSGFGY